MQFLNFISLSLPTYMCMNAKLLQLWVTLCDPVDCSMPSSLSLYISSHDGSAGKEFSCNAGDTGDVGSIAGSGRLLGEGNGKPPQYSCWDNPMDRGAWRTMVHGVTKNWTWLSMSTPNPLLLLLLSHFSRVWLLATPWTAAYQAPSFIGFSRQEYWTGVPLPSPPNPL